MMRRASRQLFTSSPVPRAVLCLVSATGLGMLGAPLWAQALDAPSSTDNAPLVMKSTRMLAETPPANPDSTPPTFVFGDRISGRTDLETIIDGRAELRRGRNAIRADRIEYYQPSDQVISRGNVRVNSAGNLFNGPELQLKIDAFEGYFLSPNYRFLSNGGNGAAQRIDFIDAKRLMAREATFTTCERTDEKTWEPAWVLSGSSFKFDQEADTGEAQGAVLRFKNVPILAFPTISFPLSGKRKSGLLPPTFNLDSTSGFEVGQPYYFNIAPNRDATLTTTVMSKRGIDLGAEARYLERDYAGILRGHFLPGDMLRKTDRWSYSLQQLGRLDTGFSQVGSLGLNLNLNRVSDNNYWRDFPRSGVSLTQRLLINDVNLSWGQGYLTTAMRVLKWQTLQDPLSVIVPPYDRLPQLTAAYTRVNVPLAGLSGFDWSVSGDFTRFSSDSLLTQQSNGDRAVSVLKLSRPFFAPAGYITPKLQLHATSYKFDTPMGSGAASATRIVPTFSLDSGLQFERQASYFGSNFTQTLEPRAFYVRTPYRDQLQLPNYDSGANDFNFASVFTENAFVGNDRISDANLLTLGLTSRLLNSDTGAEVVRLGVAQRLRFLDQKVTLRPVDLPVTDRISDLLFGTSINWMPEWSFDSTVQYNPKISKSERSTFGARYSPSNYRVVSAAVRRQLNISDSLDVGWQWPINDLWGDKGKDLGAGNGQGGGRYYSVGRLNYSFKDEKLVDAVVGLEYDGCCWIGRVVLQRSQTGVAVSNTRILFQLELVGFSRLGLNPLTTLKANIPRYQFLRDQITAPSSFTTYD